MSSSIPRRALSLGLLALALAAPAARAAVPDDIAPPSVPPIAWPAGPGKVLVETRCLFCHQGELIAAQRLTRAQWDKEVEKMATWGAPLSAAEKQVLAAYLARHFPVDARPGTPSTLRLARPTPPAP